jgi:Domain of unknown function (DUF5004)
MKTIKYIFILTAMSNLFFACKPETCAELGESTDKVKGMAGSWELTTFVQQDPNNPILEERDLSEFYVIEGVTPMHINLNVDSLTYQVTNTVGRNFFGNSGTWALDDYVAPSSITLMNATDTIELYLGSMVLPQSENMSFEMHRVCTSDQFKNVIYKFNFKRL